MGHEFPKKIDKNLLKRLFKIKEMKDELLSKSKEMFNQSELKDVKIKLNNKLKSIFPCSNKKYPQNVFKTDHKKGYCEACNTMKSLKNVLIIKKPSLHFLKYHPINVVFLCMDCHDISKLSKSKINRIERNVNKRIKRIKKAMKSDEKYLQNYKLTIDTFNSQKRKMLSWLLKQLK